MKTTPMPPSPISWRSLYGPIRVPSPSVGGPSSGRPRLDRPVEGGRIRAASAVGSRVGEEPAGVVVGQEQGLDAGQQGLVAAAGLVEIGVPLRPGGAIEGRAKIARSSGGRRFIGTSGNRGVSA